MEHGTLLGAFFKLLDDRRLVFGKNILHKSGAFRVTHQAPFNVVVCLVLVL